MTDKEQIKAEIERCENVCDEFIKNHSDTIDIAIARAKKNMCKHLKAFIDSMQEEPVSEEFEKALAEEWQGYVDRGAATVDVLEDNTQELAFAKGFYRGWNYPKSSIWHDANVLPVAPDDNHHWVVVSFKNGDIHTCFIETLVKWQRVQREAIDCWAYREDLLKL